MENMSEMLLQLEGTKTKYRKIDEDSDVKYSGQGQSEEI